MGGRIFFGESFVLWLFAFCKKKAPGVFFFWGVLEGIGCFYISQFPFVKTSLSLPLEPNHMTNGPKTNMTVEHQPFEDVSPIENG